MHEEHHGAVRRGLPPGSPPRPDSRPSLHGSRVARGEDHVVIQRSGSTTLSISSSAARIAARIAMSTASTSRMV